MIYKFHFFLYRFAYKHILQEHQNLHYGLKPHICTTCGKKFAAKSNLIQHSRRHRIGGDSYIQCSNNSEQKEKRKAMSSITKAKKQIKISSMISYTCDLCTKK